MGNWRNRPPRRFFNNRNRTSIYSYDDPDPEPYPPRPDPEFVDDGVPSWEKNFCFSIGSVPWRKVVAAKKFMHCHNNILNWDDFANEEAFQNAKERYWAKINGLPCDVYVPDPDMYIDKINWNPDIDLDLIKDIECDFFAPDEGEKDNKVGHKNKRLRRLAYISSQSYNRNPGDADNPWISNNEIPKSEPSIDKAPNRSQWGTNVNKFADLKKDDNPWERSVNQESEAVKSNRWGDHCDKLGGENQIRNHTDQSVSCNKNSENWEHSCQDTCPAKDQRWGNCMDGAWGYNQQDSRKLNNGGNSWESNFIQASGTTNNQGWRDGWGHAWSGKELNTNVNDSSNVKNDDNPWESGLTWESEAAKSNGWRDCGDKLLGWNHHSENWNKTHNNWERGCQDTCPVKDKRWGNCTGSFLGYNLQDPSKLNDGGNFYENNFTQASGTTNNRGWRDSRGRAWNREQRNNFGKNPSYLDSRESNGNRGDWNKGYRKREGNHHHHHHINDYKSTRFQGEEYQTGHFWNRGETKKRVSFAGE